MLRPSLLDPDVKLSPHPAPDSIRLGRVEGEYYPAPLSVRSVRKTFALHGSRLN